MGFSKTYTFHEVTKCNMCGSPVHEHRVLGKRLDQPTGRRPTRKTGITVSVCECKRCGLIFSSPMPIPANLQDHYGVPPESYWKEEFFQVNPNYFSGEMTTLRSLMKISPGMKSLDIGAGIGKGMLVFAKAGFDSYGIEPSQPFHERAIAKMGISADKLQLATIEEANFPEAQFDFVSFGVVLEHLIDPAGSITKAMRWLKPGGVMHIEVPSARWLSFRLANLYYKLRGTDYAVNISPMYTPFHLYAFHTLSFLQHADMNGYKVELFQFPESRTYLPRAVNFIARPYMRLTKTGMQLKVWLRKI